MRFTNYPMPIFFISSTDIKGAVVSLSAPLSLHLSKSLRIQPGQIIVLGDELRRRHRATVKQCQKEHVVAEIQETQFGPETEIPSVMLGQSILKSERMTWVIQKATELGVNYIFPLLTERVIPRLSSAQARRHQERWQRIALEAAQQSERWDVPSVGRVQTFGEFCANLSSEESSLILVGREPKASLYSIPFPTHWKENLTLLVGPEGGWTEAELTEAEKRGCRKVSLGSRILRAETATMAAMAILQARLGHLGL